MKVLVVIDDMNDIYKIQVLIGRCDFGLGSRVILTSKDMQVLKNGVDESFVRWVPPTSGTHKPTNKKK